MRQRMLVVATMCARKALQSVKLVLTATLFSHSNSAHLGRVRPQTQGHQHMTGSGSRELGTATVLR